MQPEKRIIGRKDKIDLPEFDLQNLDAKVDTGAYGSAIHCHYIEEIDDNGISKVRFQLLDPSHPEYESIYYYTDKYGIKKVKNTSGISESRFTINTRIIIFGQSYKVTFSLADRKEMRYPVLLGRKFLSNKYLVNTSETDISYKLKKRNS